MIKPTIGVKKRLLFFLFFFTAGIVSLMFRVGYVQVYEGPNLQTRAKEQQTRDRLIAPQRGAIVDRNGMPLAQSATVATIGVIHSQIKDPDLVIKILSEKLVLDEEKVKVKVNRRVALERIQSRVDKKLADEIRALNLSGVTIDEDVKRYYPYSNLAAQVIGFVGKDNQGIIGLEAKYDEYLKGAYGKIVTETDVRGIELKDSAEKRIEPIPGNHLVTSLDIIIQQYAEQALDKALEAKSAKRGAIIMMDPQSGEIYAMANKPDYDLNQPFQINNPQLETIWDTLSVEEKYKALNQMWRNFSINDTYEPGSTFKIITSAAGLEEKLVSLQDQFNCPGYRIVGGRMIKCWRHPRSHGTQAFTQGVQNSCNPVFMDIAEKLGASTFYKYMKSFGFSEKTGIDVPGEAVGIMHDLKKVGPVELATMSFGQSFQITPMQLLRAGSATINGGHLITPHFGTKVINQQGNIVKEFIYKKGRKVISEQTSEMMKTILESVVSEGTGNKSYIPGYRIGGKTATSEKLPRKNGKYIASFLAFAPAENPQVIALVLIDEPQGVYYGGTVAGPVMKELFANVLPYLKVKPRYSEKEMGMKEVQELVIPDFRNQKLVEVKKQLQKANIKVDIKGSGDTILQQFPLPGEKVNPDTKIILYTQS